MKNRLTVEEFAKDNEGTLPESALDDIALMTEGAKATLSSVLIAEQVFNYNRFQGTQGFGAQ